MIQFPGVQQPLAATYVLSHGITPSVCVLTIVPQANGVAQGGNLVFTFDSTVLVFPGCRVNFVSQSRGPWGTTWTLQILDRRWRWAFGEISGRYNVRTEEQQVVPHTEKAPQQLAHLLLAAMGEVSFDVSGLPNDARPEVRWVFSNPAFELAALCESLGCRIVLGLDNRVKIRRVGVGFDLPGGGQLTEGFAIDPPERPDYLKVIGGPTVWQSKWELEAVGEETDGFPVKINSLSYKPADGWADEDPNWFSNISDEKHRRLAQRSVYRWYRIRRPATRQMTIPGFSDRITDVFEQVLPLSSDLLETEEDDNGRTIVKQAYIEGVFANEGEPNGYDNSEKGTRLDQQFVLDEGCGIVRFAEPVYKHKANSGEVEYEPADLYLTCTHGIKNTSNGSNERYTRLRRMPGPLFGTGPRILRHEELSQRVRVRYDENNNVSGPPVVNETHLDREADHYLTAIQAEYQASASKDIEYVGLRAIEPDGAIAQVSWTVGPQGVTTRASRNKEFDLAVPSYAERRRRERASKSIHDEQQAKLEAVKILQDKGKVGVH